MFQYFCKNKVFSKLSFMINFYCDTTYAVIQQCILPNFKGSIFFTKISWKIIFLKNIDPLKFNKMHCCITEQKLIVKNNLLTRELYTRYLYVVYRGIKWFSHSESFTQLNRKHSIFLMQSISCLVLDFLQLV